MRLLYENVVNEFCELCIVLFIYFNNVFQRVVPGVYFFV